MAHDGPQALLAFDRFHPAVAVIDIGMPVMDGYELAARIRAHGGGEQPYLVALTGYQNFLGVCHLFDLQSALTKTPSLPTRAFSQGLLSTSQPVEVFGI